MPRVPSGIQCLRALGELGRVAYIPGWPALGLKATTLLGTAEGREVSLWLARDVKELSPAGPTNSKAPWAVRALPPRGASATEFLWRWEAPALVEDFSCCVRRHSQAAVGGLAGGDSP